MHLVRPAVYCFSSKIEALKQHNRMGSVLQSNIDFLYRKINFNSTIFNLFCQSDLRYFRIKTSGK